MILDTRAVTPAVASPTGTIRPGAGVSSRVGVQVTNATGWTLLLNDSEVPPPAGAGGTAAAKYVLPPRCTATYPLGTPALSYRWTGALDTSGDLLTFVFSDDPVSAQVWPGVAPSPIAASPVQSFTRDVTGAAGNVTITTLSGLNIGQLFVFNGTRATKSVYTVAGTVLIANIRPYSWATIPLNVASGAVMVTVDTPSAWHASDTLYVAWSDVGYIAPFPTGAGELPSPIDIARGLTDGSEWRSGQLNLTVAGTSNLLAIGASNWFLLENAAVTVQDNGPVLTNAFLRLLNGFTGAGGVTDFLQAVVRINPATWGQHSAALARPLLIRGSATQQLQLVLAGAPSANVVAGVSWSGRFIF